jgi:hypothetical protein
MLPIPVAKQFLRILNPQHLNLIALCRDQGRQRNQRNLKLWEVPRLIEMEIDGTQLNILMVHVD